MSKANGNRSRNWYGRNIVSEEAVLGAKCHHIQVKLKVVMQLLRCKKLTVMSTTVSKVHQTAHNRCIDSVMIPT